MVTPAMPRPRRREAGATLIEVLVTIVIIAFGLLGMAGLQMRMQSSEMEAYQRSQALLLAQDMANRIAANRLNASAYASGNTYGQGFDCAGLSTSSLANRDIKEWCDALQGAAEKTGTTNQGAMVGGRGCVALTGGDYVVTVVWQGLTPISAPPESVTCGADQYDGGTYCVEDKCRRYVTTIVRIATLI
jgi:type IV pilus assembly protein PilV